MDTPSESVTLERNLSATSSTSIPEKEIVIEKEPQELKDLNKKDIINKYLLDIIDEKKIDQILTSESVREWKAYDIMSISYNRKIDYFHNLFIFHLNNCLSI